MTTDSAELNQTQEQLFSWDDEPTPKRDLSDAGKALLLVAAATVTGFACNAMGMHACIILVYFLAVQCISLICIRRYHCLVSSVIAILAYNYFFVHPAFSLKIWGASTLADLIVMFLAALISSFTSASLRHEARRSHMAHERSDTLLETDRQLQDCNSPEDIIRIAGVQMAKIANCSTVWYVPQKDGSFTIDTAFLSDGTAHEPQEIAPEMPPLLSGSPFLGTPLGAGPLARIDRYGHYIAIRDGRAKDGAAAHIAGILALACDSESITPNENKVLTALAGETSLALGRQKALAQREAAAVVAKNEQMRANLLRSISHDLRTPLTSISGNADVLLKDAEALSAEERKNLVSDIRANAIWLNATVENLLATTKLDNGDISLKTSFELMDDIVEEALRHVTPDISRHELSVVPSEEPLLVNVDARLMVQALVNLVNNACDHTPAGSHIIVKSWRADNMVHCAVEDDGPGIAPDARERVFEPFYTTECDLADSRRSFGLGLPLCRAIAEAHGGNIMLSQAQPTGCIFDLSLPLCDLEEMDDEHAE